MNHKTPTSRFLLGLVSALALCFGLQAIAYYGVGYGTGKGESNYFSTMSRFQAAASAPAEIAFAGSSITGRIPGREVGNAGIANLGSDGGTALDGIRMLVDGRIPLPRCLVIEANTLYGGVGFGDTLIANGARGPWFKMGARLPLLGASARSSSMFYGAILRRPKILIGEAFPVVKESLVQINRQQIEQFSSDERVRLQTYREALQQLQAKGVKIVIVQFPAGIMTERKRWHINLTASILSEDLAIPYFNLARQIPKEQLQFTDSVHLAPESAARIAATMKEYCANESK